MLFSVTGSRRLGAHVCGLSSNNLDNFETLLTCTWSTTKSEVKRRSSVLGILAFLLLILLCSVSDWSQPSRVPIPRNSHVWFEYLGIGPARGVGSWPSVDPFPRTTLCGSFLFSVLDLVELTNPPGAHLDPPPHRDTGDSLIPSHGRGTFHSTTADLTTEQDGQESGENDGVSPVSQLERHDARLQTPTLPYTHRGAQTESETRLTSVGRIARLTGRPMAG